MKKGILLATYVLIAAALIGFGSWYATSLNQAPSTAQSSTTQTTQTTQNNQNTMGGLTIKDDVVGTGTVAKAGDTVTVNYVGTLDDGTKFDSSYDRNQAFSFVLGVGQVIKGWDEGVAGMKVGGKRELTIPPDMGYGANGAGSVIPPNATLHFTVELLGVSSSAQ